MKDIAENLYGQRDRHQSGLTKRHKEIEVDTQVIETNIGGYTTNRQS